MSDISEYIYVFCLRYFFIDLNTYVKGDAMKHFLI